MAITNQYGCLAILQVLLLFVDVVINSFGFMAAVNTLVGFLVISIFQDIVILALLVTLFLDFFNTFAFTVGLIRVLLKKFFWTSVIGLTYFIFTVSLHVLIFVSQWNERDEGGLLWSAPIQTMYVLHKLIAVVFYYTYKRGVYRLSDRQLYSDSQWMRQNMTKIS